MDTVNDVQPHLHNAIDDPYTKEQGSGNGGLSRINNHYYHHVGAGLSFPAVRFNINRSVSFPRFHNMISYQYPSPCVEITSREKGSAPWASTLFIVCLVYDTDTLFRLIDYCTADSSTVLIRESIREGQNCLSFETNIIWREDFRCQTDGDTDHDQEAVFRNCPRFPSTYFKSNRQDTLLL